ncbi:DNA cytosine methyltransferase, partial [Salinicola corii]
VAGRSTPTNGAFSVADPRFDQSARWHDGQAYGVRQWESPTGAITGQQSPGQGAFAVADPRHHGPAKHSNVYRIVPWGSASRCIIGAHGSGQCVADPRPGMQRERGDSYLTAGHYGVVPWDRPSGAVSAAAGHDNGRWSVADPRPLEGEYLPKPLDKVVAIIRSLDGTWHRPFTTLELAAIQGFIEPEEFLLLSGMSDSAWRERIGNAVPPPAAKAIADVMAQTLLLAWSGETFVLGSTPIWVRNLAMGMSVDAPSTSVIAGGES